jgi:hypothetical protein
MVSSAAWHNYREVDAIVAVRDQNQLANSASGMHFEDRKPATKLYNAWLAGVPAVVSPESAFRQIRLSRLDYLEARDIPEIVARLIQLKNDPLLRRAMIANGIRRSAAFASDSVTKDWITIIERGIVPEYCRWSQSSLYRRRFFAARHRLLNAGFKTR